MIISATVEMNPLEQVLTKRSLSYCMQGVKDDIYAVLADSKGRIHIIYRSYNREQFRRFYRGFGVFELLT
jgi:hypothetical protein